MLPAGEVFRIAFDPPDTATHASCDPERHEEATQLFERSVGGGTQHADLVETGLERHRQP